MHLAPDATWLDPTDAAGSLTAAAARRWAASPSAAVFHDPERGWVTAAELEARTRLLAGRLHGAGVRPGQRILFSCGPSVATVEAYLAGLRLGAVVVPANTGYTAAELAHLVADADPVLAVLDDPARLDGVEGAPPVVSSAVERPDAEPPELDRTAPDAHALLPYTSGTTGRPKGVVLTHRNLLAGAASVVAAWRWTAEDRLILALPLFHMHGLGVGVHGTLLSGGSAVIVERFAVDDVLAAAAEHRATMFFGVPTMWERLAASDRVGELARLRLCVSGSAPLPAELHQRLETAAGQRVLERYGMTETVMLVSNPFDGERRPGAVGFPLPGVELRLAAGDESEIQVRGPNVFGEYWGRPDATAEAFTDDGWFRTGDLGARDDDGYVRIVGRAKELIITGGYNVYPREIEDAVGEHASVAEVAVAGVPDPEWGERVVALVVPVAGATVDGTELAAHAAERLARYKHPREWHAVPSLPRNAMGKLVRPEVTEMAKKLATTGEENAAERP